MASALAQQGVQIEVLVSDDGSSDGTRQFVESVAASDPRVRLLVDNPTPGVFENVEHLMSSSRGDAFTVLGDDDLLDPDFCRRLCQPMERDPTLILTFCDHRTIDSAGRLMARATSSISKQYGRAALSEGPLARPEMVALRGAIWLGFALYRRTAFEGEVFDRSCGTAADWDFAIRAAQRGKLSYVPAMLGAYRDHPLSASRGIRNEAQLVVNVLSKHVMRDPAAELMRQAMLRAAAGRNSYHMAVQDRNMCRQSLSLYFAMGGRIWSPHVLAALLLVRLPLPAATATRAALSSTATALRAFSDRSTTLSLFRLRRSRR